MILAGGAGERFWPRSRRARPKPLLRVLGRGTLLDAALAHARRFAARYRVWIVCTADNAAALRAASGLPARRILVEPRARDTAAAVAFAAATIARRERGQKRSPAPPAKITAWRRWRSDRFRTRSELARRRVPADERGGRVR